MTGPLFCSKDNKFGSVCLPINQSVHPSVRLSVCLSVCLSGFVEPTLCTTSTVHSFIVYHRPALCTTDLRCTPWCTRGLLKTCTLGCSQATDLMVVHNAVLSVRLSVVVLRNGRSCLIVEGYLQIYQDYHICLDQI